jgi:hypothetical protein
MFDNEKMKALPEIETADIYTSHGQKTDSISSAQVIDEER